MSRRNNDLREDRVSRFAFMIWRFFKYSVLFVVVAYCANCVMTPKHLEDVATGDYREFDRVMAGELPKNVIKNKVLSDVADEMRVNLSPYGAMRHEAQRELKRLCEKECTQVEKPTYYCSTSPYCVNYSQTRTETHCALPDTCTDELQAAQKHLENLSSAGYLNRAQFPVYMEKYQNSGLTILQKTALWYMAFAAFLAVLFSIIFGLKMIKLQRENKLLARVRSEMEKARAKETYRVSVPEDASPESIRTALEHKLLDEELRLEAERAQQILEQRAAAR